LSDLDVCVSPIALALFTGQGAQAQVSLGWGARAVPGDDVAEVVGSTAIATLYDHGMQATGREIGELL
jgi:hypothetical protein